MTELGIPVGGAGADSVEISALLDRPKKARALVALAHGAGAGMRHPFFESIVPRLSARGIATLRYQFPYMERGGRRPDPRGVLLATVRAAVAAAGREARGLALLAGGKSMGGRMTSLAASEGSLGPVRGLVFLGFPLHAAGRVGTERAEHLQTVGLPMLFLQGTRDSLADLDSVRDVTTKLGSRATLHVVESADHSFHVLKRSGRTDDEVHDELASEIAAFASRFATSRADAARSRRS